MHYCSTTQVYDGDLTIDNNKETIKFCSICCTKPCDAILMECGHAGICYECACEMCKNIKKCHICRDIIKRILQYGSNIDNCVEIIRAIKIISN